MERKRLIQEVKKEQSARDRLWKANSTFKTPEYAKRYKDMQDIQAVLEAMTDAEFFKMAGRLIAKPANEMF
jgi:acyl carrier protein phosphodiesterase